MYVIASLLKSFKHTSLQTLVWIFPKLENIHLIDVDEAGHNGSLRANSRKSVGTPSGLRAFHQLISERLVATLVKNVEGKGDACA